MDKSHLMLFAIITATMVLFLCVVGYEDALLLITIFIVTLVLMQLAYIYSTGHIKLTMTVFKRKDFDCFLDENNPKSWLEQLKIIDFTAETLTVGRETQILHWCV